MLRLGDVEARSSSYSCNQRSELMFLIAQHSSFLIYVRAFDQIYLKSDWQVGALGSGCWLRMHGRRPPFARGQTLALIDKRFALTGAPNLLEQKKERLLRPTRAYAFMAWQR